MKNGVYKHGPSEFGRGQWAWRQGEVRVIGFMTRESALRDYYRENGHLAFAAGVRHGRKLERGGKVIEGNQ